ncbi:MAG: leucine-rich repeat domain-containing protein, partial [Burkholderiales bacterium]
MSISYNISNRRTKIIKSTINDNLRNKYGFNDTLKKLQGLRNRLKSGTIDKSQFLLHIREIKNQSEEINALFKPTHEFNYWFRGKDYRVDRMARIIEHLEDTYSTLFQGEQSISSNKGGVNFHLNIDQANYSAKDQSYVNSNPVSKVDEPEHMSIPNTNNQEDLDVSSLADDIFQTDNLPGRVVGSSRDNKLENLIGQLEVWITEAPNGEWIARLTAKSRILDAYKRNLDALNLDKLGLTALPIGVFNHLTKLKQLSLTNNWLSVLPDVVFNGLVNLQRLSLCSSQVRVLPDGVFNGLVNLQRLSLYNNQLNELPDGVFNGLTNLKWLDLTGNKLSELCGGVFDGLTNLTELELYNNQLSILTDGAFNGLTNLKRLDLSCNKLSELPDGVVNELTNLESLHLSDNQLT